MFLNVQRICVWVVLLMSAQACRSKIAVRALEQEQPCVGVGCSGNTGNGNNSNNGGNTDSNGDGSGGDTTDPGDNPDPIDTSCAWDRPTGDCPDGLVCDDGVCETPVGNMLCGEANTEGDCGEDDWIFRPDSTIPVRVSRTCCNDEKVSLWGCVLGTCASPPCSLDNIYGVCPEGLYCKQGVCEAAPCGPSFQTGVCAEGKECVSGRCAKTQCVGEEAGYCGDDVCDTQRNVCVRAYCSSETLNGYCASANTVCCNTSLHASDGCVLGTCVTPLCQPAYPGGRCEEGEVCSNGRCAQTPCSASYPEGACAPGFECLQGTCIKSVCSALVPNGFCPAGQKCASQGACAPYVCGNNFPNGPCSVVGQRCQNGVCVQPACSSQYPGGVCEEGFVCSNGACKAQPCSALYPEGVCSRGRVCQEGQCVVATCSLQHPQGVCVGNDLGKKCVEGACVPYLCSSQFPEGPCPVLGHVCFDGVCEKPACSDVYVSGHCNDERTPPHDICINGSCERLACSTQITDGVCPSSQVCCSAELSEARGGCVLGTCVKDSCSENTPNGYCAGSQRCKNGACVDYTCEHFSQAPCPVQGQSCQNGVCVTPSCDRDHPSGVCADPLKICLGGACVFPACSAVALHGVCSEGKICCGEEAHSTYGCTLGQCIATPCSTETPTGACIRSDEVCCTQTMHDANQCDAVGTCVDALCSETFPAGVCVGSEEGKTCIDGECYFLCDEETSNGWCPGGFSCVEGSCRAVCANDTDCDTISNAHEGVGDADGDGFANTIDRDSDNDGIDDVVESGDRDIATPPVNSDNDAFANAYDEDSDNDHISDAFEVGASSSYPVDTDHDGVWDMLDTDSDDDGVWDACEVAEGLAGVCSATGIVDYDVGVTAVLDTDADGLKDYTDTDSDDDGVPDAIEARVSPHRADTLVHTGVDHDEAAEGEGGVWVPDYRDEDSDNDGVLDGEEDVDGDGVVDCQLDGDGAAVPDTRATPTCNGAVLWALSPFSPSYVYNYNPGCAQTPSVKCLLGESSRVHPDTDGDAVADHDDGVYKVCSDRNLKPVNMFYSLSADYALALEEAYTQSRVLRKAGSEVGLTFGSTSTTSGAYPVAGFLVKRVPHSTAMAATASDSARALIEKALAQETVDRSLFSSATGVSQWTFVINKNFTSFDGYGAVVSRYRVLTDASVSAGLVRDRLVSSLDASFTGMASVDAGPFSTDFTVLSETLYRYDNGTTGAVLLLVAVVPTSSPSSESYGYRPRCSERNAGTCVSLGLGCVLQEGVCGEDVSYQPPVFYAENMLESSLSQYGDGLSSYCQSMVQRNSPLDVLWVVDNSGSMAEEINQVLESSNLFFGLLNRSEADYRVAQTTTSASSPLWEPTSNHTSPASDEEARVNGSLTGGFTGAVGGVVNASLQDRDALFDCTGYPDNCNTYGCGGDACCSECQPGDGLIYSPACYFASRLPCDDGSGREFGMLMGEWALYVGGAQPVCADAVSSDACATLTGCVWQNNRCEPGHCVLPTGYNTVDECNGNSTSYVPAGSDALGDEREPGTCEWDPSLSACVPSYQVACGNVTSASLCKAPACMWTGTLCVPKSDRTFVLCDASSESSCAAVGGGWCVWDASSNTCSAPSRYVFREGSEKIVVVLGDEEDCYVKDHNYNNECEFLGYGASSMGYSDPVRIARTQSYTASYQSRGATVYAITGDKANPALPPSASNGGCYTGAEMTAEAGQGYINVAEGTGGGWGSICAVDLYPTIESIIVGALGASSAYRLEGNIAGRRIQPIASTLQVAVETCVVASEYPTCGSGKTVRTIPRSRENGFDFDAKNNTLVLYGDARAATQRDIVVSYRYFVDNAQPPEGNPDCPCAATTAPGCACPAGQRCGRVGEVDACAAVITAQTCDNTPGCSWNKANGGVCVVNGICEADPTCGGSCGEGEVCNARTGLCECDIGCGDGCAAGLNCDDERTSPTCGTCVCDDTCGGGCAPGFVCDSVDTSITCGQCLCDTTCGGGCAVGQQCNSNTASATCGYCEPAPCPVCASGYRCDRSTATCVCDTTCGGCGQGRVCDSSVSSETCGQCLCDTSCGGCPQGQVCNSDPSSLLCGLCSVDPTCGGCDGGCLDVSERALCVLNTACRWVDGNGGGTGACQPQEWHVCDVAIGLCRPDPTCNNACASDEICDSNTGECVCDVLCGGGCASSQTCDDNLLSGSCGQCVCDPTCSGGCPLGQLCHTEEGPQCGVCEVDPTCDGGCPFVNGVHKTCNPNTGLCEIDPTCGDACSSVQTCDTATGQCVCDTSCDFACDSGFECDDDTESETCGACVCDTSCGETCGQGLLCDNNNGCAQAHTAQACGGVAGCSWQEEVHTCVSVTCGQCVVDPTCGGCAQGLRCNPVTGICEASCPSCALGSVCDPASGQCVCNVDCGGGCDPGTVCDNNVLSATCGQCLCDTTCGGGCPGCQVCDSEESSGTCGQCVTVQGCGGCGFGQVCDVFSGCCVTDPNCGGLCPENFRCDPLTWECIPSGG